MPQPVDTVDKMALKNMKNIRPSQNNKTVLDSAQQKKSVGADYSLLLETGCGRDKPI